MFSIYLSPDNYKFSKLIFGKYDIEKYAAPGSKESEILWSPVTSRISPVGDWTNDLLRASFWDQPFFEGNHYLIADSGTSYAMAPVKCV
jgi:hypothetical protein